MEASTSIRVGIIGQIVGAAILGASLGYLFGTWEELARRVSPPTLTNEEIVKAVDYCHKNKLRTRFVLNNVNETIRVECVEYPEIAY